jgi:hypothetical protein
MPSALTIPILPFSINLLSENDELYQNCPPDTGRSLRLMPASNWRGGPGQIEDFKIDHDRITSSSLEACEDIASGEVSALSGWYENGGCKPSPPRRAGPSLALQEDGEAGGGGGGGRDIRVRQRRASPPPVRSLLVSGPILRSRLRLALLRDDDDHHRSPEAGDKA